MGAPFRSRCEGDRAKAEGWRANAGLAGSARSAISSVATAIYSTVLADRQTQTIGSQIPAALVRSGVDESNVAAYMEAITAGGDLETLKAIPGVTDEVIATVSRAYQWAYADAFQTVFYVSIAFGVLGIAFACLTPNVDELLTNKVAVRLNQDSKKGKKKEIQMSADQQAGGSHRTKLIAPVRI